MPASRGSRSPPEASRSRSSSPASGPSATTSTGPRPGTSRCPVNASDSASTGAMVPSEPASAASFGSAPASSRTHWPFQRTSGCLSATISANSAAVSVCSPIATSHRNCPSRSAVSPAPVIPAPGSVTGSPMRSRARSRRAPAAVSSAGSSTPRPAEASDPAPSARKSATCAGSSSSPVGRRSDRLASIGGNSRAASASPRTTASCGSPTCRPSTRSLAPAVDHTCSTGTSKLGSSAPCRW